MPQHLEGNPKVIRCMFENWIAKRTWMKCIHDGSKTAQGRRYFFTRIYAIMKDGKSTGVVVKFTYDYRIGLADMTIDDEAVDIISKARMEDGGENKVEVEKVKEAVLPN